MNRRRAPTRIPSRFAASLMSGLDHRRIWHHILSPFCGIPDNSPEITRPAVGCRLVQNRGPTSAVITIRVNKSGLAAVFVGAHYSAFGPRCMSLVLFSRSLKDRRLASGYIYAREVAVWLYPYPVAIKPRIHLRKTPDDRLLNPSRPSAGLQPPAIGLRWRNRADD